MVVAPGVVRRERQPFLVVRLVPDEVLPAGIRQPVDGAFEPESGELLRLTGPRPEAGTPKQPLCLRNAELPPPDRDSHALQHRSRFGWARSLGEGLTAGLFTAV